MSIRELLFENCKFLGPSNRFHSATAIDDALMLFLLFSTIFIPYIQISNSFFLSIEELVIVLLGFRLIQRRFFYIDKYVMLLACFACYILFVILINPNRTHLSEYFEIYKVLRYLLIYMFAIYYFWKRTNFVSLKKWIHFSFLLLVLFNIFHFFDLFQFNRYITILYDPNGIDVHFFGKNSLGLPGPKRMLGTMGNPNENAILFLFYFTFYIDQVLKYRCEMYLKVLLFTSLVMILMCQSRTSIVAIFVLLVAVFIMINKTKNDVFYFLKIVAFMLLIFSLYIVITYNLNSTYLTNTSLRFEKNSSVRGRLDVWKFLISSWTENPIFGFGPNKEYMYYHKLYPENEYLFYLWRYGIFGLLFYLAIIFQPLSFIRRGFKSFNWMIYVLAFICIISLTNNPLSNPKFSLIFAIIVGYCVCLYQSEALINDEQNT